MSKKIKPLADQIVVEPIEQDDVTPSGLVIPDTAKEKPERGKVIAIGPGRKNEAGKHITMDVTVGNIVLFSRFSGSNFKLTGQEYLILKESDVLAVVSG